MHTQVLIRRAEERGQPEDLGTEGIILDLKEKKN
jgi:hypothetical protein